METARIEFRPTEWLRLDFVCNPRDVERLTKQMFEHLRDDCRRQGLVPIIDATEEKVTEGVYGKELCRVDIAQGAVEIGNVDIIDYVTTDGFITWSSTKNPQDRFYKT